MVYMYMYFILIHTFRTMEVISQVTLSFGNIICHQQTTWNVCSCSIFGKYGNGEEHLSVPASNMQLCK